MCAQSPPYFDSCRVSDRFPRTARWVRQVQCPHYELREKSHGATLNELSGQQAARGARLMSQRKRDLKAPNDLIFHCAVSATQIGFASSRYRLGRKRTMFGMDFISFLILLVISLV